MKLDALEALVVVSYVTEHTDRMAVNKGWRIVKIPGGAFQGRIYLHIGVVSISSIGWECPVPTVELKKVR